MGHKFLQDQQSKEEMDIYSLHQDNFLLLTTFVIEYETFYKVSTFSRNNFFLSTMSLTKWYYTSICFIVD